MRTEETMINLIFDAGRGSVSQAGREAACNEPCGDLPTPVRAGYRFVGWFCGDREISADTVIESAEDMRLVAKWERVKEKQKLSSYKKQKYALIALSCVAVALIIAWVVVAQLISIYTLTDTYVKDGKEYTDYYKIKRVDGIYKLFDTDGNLMPTNGIDDDVFIADRGSGNQYKINAETGEYKLRAVIIPDDMEAVQGTTLLLYPQISSANVYSIEVKNGDGTYKFFHTPQKTYIDGYEDSLVEYNKDLYAKLAFACGWTSSTRKLTAVSEGVALKDGKIDYAVYGLDEPQATFTIQSVLFKKDENGKTLYANNSPVIDYLETTDADGNTVKSFKPDPDKLYTVKIGDATPSKAGYYAQLEGFDSIYIFTATNLAETVLEPIESLVVPKAVHSVSINMHSMVNRFFLKALNEWTENTDDGEVLVAFTYEDLDRRQNTIYTTNPYINLGTDVMAGYNINATSASSALGSLYNMQYVGCRKLGLTKEVLAEYGLNQNVYYLSYGVDLNEADGKDEYMLNEIMIGRTPNENGNYYIASFTYDMIVEVTPNYLSFLEWDAVDWYEKYFLRMNVSYVREMSFQFGDQTYEFKLDNGLSYAYYLYPTKDDNGKPVTLLQSVDLAEGSLYQEGTQWKYRTNRGAIYDIVAIVDLDKVKSVTQREAILNPDMEDIVYVEIIYYYVNSKNEKVQIVPDYVKDDIDERDGSFYYVYKKNGEELEIPVFRQFGEPIYRYKKGLEATVMLSTTAVDVYCNQYEGSNPANKHLLDYSITVTDRDDMGHEKVDVVSAVDNFRRFYNNMLYFSLGGDVNEAEFQKAMGMSVADYLATKEALAVFTLHVEDYASVTNGFTVYDGEGKEHPLYPENNQKYMVVRFYKWTDWKAVITVEVMEQDENGNWVSTQDEVVGKFFVSTEYLNNLGKDLVDLVTGKLVTNRTPSAV